MTEEYKRYMSLCITRTTLFNWNNGINCTPERQEIVVKAKAFIASFMEQAVLRGKINPASGIFLMKNWLGYKDSYSFEEATENKQYNKPTRTAAEIADRYKDALELPEMERPEL